ncbi:MAG: class I SAM-dependent methyltransferase [Pseudomonadota bacterium]
MGFSSDWLALREPADRAARDDTLLKQAAAAAGPSPVILDLGCGTGATVRAMTPHLKGKAQWRLLDNDPDLLQCATLSAGETAEPWQVDLKQLDALPIDGVTLVTASALLDLVSEDWLVSFVALINAPFYAPLTYNGTMRWTPEDPRDARMTKAFNAHQRRNKGFGPALGPDAPSCAKKILTKAGFDVHCAPSPWQLKPDMRKLFTMLTDGIAQAAFEAGEEAAHSWGDSRRKSASQTTCLIGHQDLLALPRNIS